LKAEEREPRRERQSQKAHSLWKVKRRTVKIKERKSAKPSGRRGEID